MAKVNVSHPISRHRHLQEDMAAMLAEIKAEEERKEKELEEAIIREAEEAKKV